MTHGFRETTIDAITPPENLPEYLPYLLDDGTLAFHLRTRPKILWWMLLNKEKLYTVHRIPKRTGGVRIIHAPEIRFKRFLQKLEGLVLKPIQNTLGTHVTAYRPKKSTRDAVLQHLPPCPVCDAAEPGKIPKSHDCPRQGVYIHMDIKDFFPSTKRSWIRNYFKEQGYNHYVSGILADLMTVGNIPHQKNPKKLRVGVPQGAPTSGTICNIIADARFDHKILAYFDKLNAKLPDDRKWKYSRYSDDMSITCGDKVTRKKINDVINNITEMVQESGYRINRKKTRVIHKYFRKSMLGIVFNQHPNIAKDRYMKLRALCHNCLVQGFEPQLKITHKVSVEELCYWLHGTINYVGQIHPARGAKLRAVYEDALVAHGLKTPAALEEAADDAHTEN